MLARVPVAAAVVLALASVAATGCARSTTKTPKAPDISALRAAYAPPDGTFDAKAAPVVAQGVYKKLQQLSEGQSVLAEVVKILPAFGAKDDPKQTDSGGLTTVEQGLSGSAKGWARVRHVCEGYSGVEPPDADANGRIDLFALYSTKGLSDHLWGEFAECRLPAGAGKKQRLEGVLSLVLLEGGDAGGLLQLDLTWLDDAEQETPLVLDFAFAPDGVVSTSEPVPGGGRVLVTLQTQAEQGSNLTIRDKDGVWGCAVEPGYQHGACQRDDEKVEF